jgi:STE24 endopeptidase
MSIYFWLLVLLLVGEYFLDLGVETLNLRSSRGDLPAEFSGLYEPKELEKSRHYLKETTRFALRRRAFFLILLVLMIALGGFDRIDAWARSFDQGPVGTGLIFGAVLSVLRGAFGLPFAAYATFSIEQRFGFNRTTIRTFVLDLVKGTVLGAVIGGLLFGSIVYFFENAGPLGWLYAWLAVTAFGVLLSFLAPVVLFPLFNRFSPIPEGELKQAIEDYARQQNFQMKGVFTMDSSTRSSKSNAFFAGFGKFRRLVIFDTLISRQSAEEIVAVVAHEVGHYKRGHIPKSMALSIASSGLMFFILARLINRPELFEAFGMAQPSVYASILLVGLIYSPISRILSVFPNLLSRKFEFEADRFSIETYPRKEALVSALKKLSRDNLSNLTPHPWKVAVDYSHPPILERVKALRTL